MGQFENHWFIPAVFVFFFYQLILGGCTGSLLLHVGSL